MNAIETLAAVTDVCSDKTGTITLGKMVMKQAWIPAKISVNEEDVSKVELDTKHGQIYAVESGSDPYYPRGRVMVIDSYADGDKFGQDDDSDDEEWAHRLVNQNTIEPPLRDMVLCASLCSSATIHRSHDKEDEGKGKWEAHGDATEVALLVVRTVLKGSTTSADNNSSISSRTNWVTVVHTLRTGQISSVFRLTTAILGGP